MDSCVGHSASAHSLQQLWIGISLLRKVVPSLTALVALEAVVRHKSFTRAAGELGVTQAAVSRQVALLEKELGVPLFLREHRGVQPTHPCIALGATLTDAFKRVADGVEAVRASKDSEILTIGATLAFSAFWLLPRLGTFRRLHPEVQLRVVSQDEKLSLDGGDVDIAIRYGNPPFGDCIVLASRGDMIVPVASPEYKEKLSGSSFWKVPSDLIETDVTDRSWVTWPDWFDRVGHAGVVAKASMTFSHYTEAIAAARAGQGVALGWGVLVDGFLKDGSLVQVGEGVDAEGRHNIIVPKRTDRHGLGDIIAAWMAAALGE